MHRRSLVRLDVPSLDLKENKKITNQPGKNVNQISVMHWLRDLVGCVGYRPARLIPMNPMNNFENKTVGEM